MARPLEGVRLVRPGAGEHGHGGAHGFEIEVVARPAEFAQFGRGVGQQLGLPCHGDAPGAFGILLREVAGGDVADIAVAGLDQPGVHLRPARQPFHRPVGRRAELRAAAVTDKRALEGLGALRAHGHLGLARIQHRAQLADQPRHHRLQLAGLRGDVGVGEEARVIAVARVLERIINVRQVHAHHVQAALLQHPQLDGAVVQVVVLHAGGRFHLDQPHLPRLVAAEHVGADQDAVGLEGGLEQGDGAGLGQQVLGCAQGLGEFLVVLDEDAVGELLLRRRPHAVAGGEAGLGGGGDDFFVRLVELQPQAFGALPAGDEFGFGEVVGGIIGGLIREHAR